MSRFLILLTLLSANANCLATEPVSIGSRRELFVDDALIERFTGQADLRLHQPTTREVALETNEAWEGNSTNYVTVFQDGDKYRMYYRGSHFSYLGGKDRPNTRDVYCYAESLDGVHWTKPELGLFDWDGSKKNNIVWDGVGAHAFVPFRDTNPNCAADAKYKALGVGGKQHGLYAFQSADAIHWTLMHPEPVITKGAFDSQNVAFWDAERNEYREYHRDFREGRDIRTGTSQDFLKWTEPQYLSYSANVDPGRREGQPGDVKDPVGEKYPVGRVSELYTNQIAPYYRAPHLLLGFPTRYIDRGWTESVKSLPRYDYRQIRAKDSRREGTAVTDGMFMTSRDRQQFSVWPESFLRPGLRTRDSWFYGDTYQNWGLVETKSLIDDAPPELSFYVTERTMQETGGVLRRYSLRIDGFVSLHAPLVGGELITKPLIFTGRQLQLNVSTSAAGSVRVEIQDATGRPLRGYELAACQDVYGDDLNRTVIWAGNPDLAALAGKPVRLRFEVKDADLYSFRFDGDRPIKIVAPKILVGDDVPAVRTPLGIPNDYKPWIVQLKSGDLLVVAFCFGGTPSNELPQGASYLERAVFWRSSDGGKTWGARDERPDLHGREFSLTCLSDGTLIMPCHFLANDAANEAGYTHSKIFRSVDEGKTWTEQRVGPEGFPDKAQTSTDWTAVEIPDPKQPGKTLVQLGVGMQNGKDQAPAHVFLWQSRDGGATWDKSLGADTDGWVDVDGFFSQSTTYRSAQGILWHPVRVDATGPHWKLPVIGGVEVRSGDQDDRMMLWKSAADGRTWRRHRDGGRFGSYGEMYPRFQRLHDGRLLLTFTVRSNSRDGHPLGLRAIISPDDGETWDFERDRIVLSDRNHGPSGGGFGNSIQLADQTLISVYSFRGEDNNTHVEAVRWNLPAARSAK